MTNAIIWTKNKNEDCTKAIILAERMGLDVEVRNIDSGAWDQAKLEAAIPGAKTVPQVVIGDVVIGGLAELVAKSKEQNASAPKASLKTKEERKAAIKSKASAAHEARSATQSDKIQARNAARMSLTPEQHQAAIAKTNTMRAAASLAPKLTPEQHLARHEASKAARADKIVAAKAKNADARAARLDANKQRVNAARAERRQRVGLA